MSDSLQPHGLQHARTPSLSATRRACSNSYPLSQRCHPTISSSVIPFFSCPQSFPASGAFPLSQVFASCGQSTGASASASVLPMNIQEWFPLVSISLQSSECVITAYTYLNAYLLHISLSYYPESSSCLGKVRIWQQDTIFTLKEFSILNLDSAQNFLREWIPSKGATERMSLSGLETVQPVA